MVPFTPPRLTGDLNLTTCYATFFPKSLPVTEGFSQKTRLLNSDTFWDPNRKAGFSSNFKKKHPFCRGELFNLWRIHRPRVVLSLALGSGIIKFGKQFQRVACSRRGWTFGGLAFFVGLTCRHLGNKIYGYGCVFGNNKDTEKNG